MERKIGLCPFFTDEEQIKRLTDFCIAKGFTPKVMTSDDPDIDFINECEVLYGLFPNTVFKNAKKLKWFQFGYVGVEPYTDRSLYYNPDVILTNTKNVYGTTISEHLICVTLMMMRNMKAYMTNSVNHVWQKEGDVSSIEGSCALVVGLGDIGGNYAKRLKAMGAYVKAVRHDKNKPSPFADEIFGPDEIDKAIEGCDIVALCMPSTKETENTMTRERFLKMKKGSYFINVGRPSAIDEEALWEMLKNHHLRGAACDVFSDEPLSEDSPVWDIPNLIITPHIAGNSTLPSARKATVDFFMENMERYLKGEKLKNIIDRDKGY